MPNLLVRGVDEEIVRALKERAALVNDLALVTRNVGDFHGLGVRLRNPFVSAERGE